jgi:hypothetical protein
MACDGMMIYLHSNLPDARNRIYLYIRLVTIIKNMKNEKSTVLGVAFGVAVGSVIGVLTNNLGLWISLGIAIGAGIGISISQKKKNDTNDKN